MKTGRTKVGTVLDTGSYQRLRAAAARQGRKMSDLLGEAINQYLRETPEDLDRRRNTLRLLESRVRLPREEFEKILELDYYDQ
jgi:predicted DNA-binding protein